MNKKSSSYVGIFTDEAQNCVDTDQGPWTTNAGTAVCDDGPRPMNVSHEGNKREQLIWLWRCPVVWPPRVVQVCHKLCFIGLREEKHTKTSL